MSDLFYPDITASNKYCVAILAFIPKLRYSVSVHADEPMGLLFVADPPSSSPRMKCKFPRHYVPHLERFLWRYYLFSGLYEHFHLKKPQLNRIGIGFLERMLVMMDTVVEQLVMACSRVGDKLSPDLRVEYFDYYLATEFIVGRHDPDSVDAWRRNPNNLLFDLERIEPDSLGKCFYPYGLFCHDHAIRLEQIYHCPRKHPQRREMRSQVVLIEGRRRVVPGITGRGAVVRTEFPY